MKDLFIMAWPIGCLVLSNVFYHVTAKEILPETNAFANMVVTYIVGAIVSLILFFTIGQGHDLVGEIKSMNWAPYVLGMAIVGLEVGGIFLYKVGWDISIGSTVANIILAVCMVFVGLIFYKESVDLTTIAGIALCMAGLFLINK